MTLTFLEFYHVIWPLVLFFLMSTGFFHFDASPSAQCKKLSAEFVSSWDQGMSPIQKHMQTPYGQQSEGSPCPCAMRPCLTSRFCCISIAPHLGQETQAFLMAPFPSPCPLSRSLLSLELSESLVAFMNSLSFLDVLVWTAKYFQCRVVWFWATKSLNLKSEKLGSSNSSFCTSWLHDL